MVKQIVLKPLNGSTFNINSNGELEISFDIPAIEDGKNRTYGTTEIAEYTSEDIYGTPEDTMFRKFDNRYTLQYSYDKTTGRFQKETDNISITMQSKCVH